MSANRRLEHELFRNLRDEEVLIASLEADRTLQLQLFQTAQSQTDLKSQGRADLSKHYLARDDAFFKQLHILQQLSSNVKLVTNYHQPVAMPKIKQSDARLYSLLEKHDPKKSDYLADFEEFIRDKKAHEKEIERVNKWIIDIHDEIRALIIPQLLYFLLEWLPLIILIYRYFAPVNSLDYAIKQGQILERELCSLEQQIEAEDTRFYKRWNEKYTEYSALSMNEKKLTHLRSGQTEYEKILESHHILEVYVKNCKHSGIQQTYQQFKNQPSYVNLFHVCSLLCEQKFNDSKKTPEIDQVLDAMNKLYPEAQAELQQFAQATLFQLSAASIFEMLENKYTRLIESSKGIHEKVKLAKKRMEQIAGHSTTLNRATDEKKIYDYKVEMQKLSSYIEKGRTELSKRRKLIEPYKNFLNNRTGENLKALYLFMSDPAHQEETAPFAELLRKLYPAALETMEEEQQGIISIQTRDIVILQQNYLRGILDIEKSRDPEMTPLKEVASALHQLLNTADWTWAHFNTLERAIQKNPQYALNPTLVGLFNRATQMVAESRQFQPSITQKRPAPIVQSPEIILNQSNPLPTFFQPPSRVSPAANALIKNIMGDINAYSIRTSDQTNVSSEEKQATIDSISNNMLQYIEMLSTDDAIQTISPQHLALLRDLSTFIRQMTSQASPSHLNEEDMAHIDTQLKQLAPEHPIRKGVEFLINLFRTKSEYMAIDTRYAQIQLRKDIRFELHALEADAAQREQKMGRHKHSSSAAISPEARRNLHQWSMAKTFQNHITAYVTNLNQFASPQNANESREVQAVVSLADKIYSMLRYETRKYGEIPQLLQKLEHQCGALREHPVCEAITHLVSALKETQEYAAVPGARVGDLRAKK